MWKIILIIILITIIILCIFQKKEYNTNIIIIDENDNLTIDEITLDEMTDIVTEYSLQSNDYSEKLILIYMSTFHLFDMNFPAVVINKLDLYLAKFKYDYNNYDYPQGDLYHNLQRFIITNITHYIINSERQLQNNFENDREIIYVYLKALFTHSQILGI